MSLREEIEQYRDKDKLVAYYKCDPNQVNASGNGVLYTSEYYLTLWMREELTLADRNEFMVTMLKCEHPDYKGLIRRGPHHPDQNAPDDYIGLMAAAAKLAPALARDVLEYGKHSGWVYNNVEPGKWTGTSWFGRMPQLIAHFHWAAGEQPPLWLKWVWAAVIGQSAFAKKENQDAWMMSWLLIQTRTGKSWICEQAEKLWWKKLFANFGDQAQGICARTLHEGHPLGKYFVLHPPSEALANARD